MTNRAKVRTALLRACYAHTKSLTLVRECKKAFDTGKRELELLELKA